MPPTYQPELFESANGLGSSKRVEPSTIQTRLFAAATGTLALLTPVAMNTSTGKWSKFNAGASEVHTITANATPASDGTFTITVTNPVTGIEATTAGIAHDATPAVIQAALEALANVDAGDVVATISEGDDDLGDASAVVTLTWGGQFAGRDLTVTAAFGGLTGNAHVFATATAGGSSSNPSVGEIRGFIWPDAAVLDETEDSIHNVLLTGKLHYDDLPVATTVDSDITAAAWRQALRDAHRFGLIVEGIPVS
jgi:hypothetical protein